MLLYDALDCVFVCLCNVLNFGTRRTVKGAIFSRLSLFHNRNLYIPPDLEEKTQKTKSQNENGSKVFSILPLGVVFDSSS